MKTGPHAPPLKRAASEKQHIPHSRSLAVALSQPLPTKIRRHASRGSRLPTSLPSSFPPSHLNPDRHLLILHLPPQHLLINTTPSALLSTPPNYIVSKTYMEDNNKPHQIHLQILSAADAAHSDAGSIPDKTAARKVASRLEVLTRFHAGYFRISLALCGQALLWKTLSEPTTDARALRPVVRAVPSLAFALLWSLSFLTLATLCVLYAFRCALRFHCVRAELAHHVGMNYLFAPWISWLLLLQSAPRSFPRPSDGCYHFLWLVFSLPILALDVKIYGQWFTQGKKFLSMVANPTSQITVIGNLVGAQAAAQMGWRETAVCMFAVGIAHYLVLFVTLYQRFLGSNSLPAMLRPVFFLFFAAPSMASLAWDAISSTFDTSCKMFFFLSLFLFASVV